MQVEEESSYKASFLEKVDIFGIAISIRFNHFKSHRTYLGGLMTIAILTIIGYQTVKLTKDVFDQDSPTVIQEHRYVYQPEIFNITRSSFNIAVGVQNGASLHFKDESVYYIRGTQQIVDRVLNVSTGEYDQYLSYRSITLEGCTQDHFLNTETNQYFSKLPLDKLYCIALNETELAIEGEFSAMKYKAIQFEVVICSNTTTVQNCASQETINSMLSTPRLGVYLTDAFVNVTNRDKPYYYVGRNLFWPSSGELQKEVRLYLQNNYITSDIGYFCSKMKQDRVINYSSSREVMTVRHNQVLFNFVIAYEKNSEATYQRSYPKLDTAFAEIGGFFNALISIGCMLCWPISLLELNRKLINSSYQLTLTPGENEGQEEEDNQSDDLGNPTSGIAAQEYQQNQNSEKRIGLPIITQNQLKIPSASLQQVKSKETTNLVISEDLNRVDIPKGNNNLDNFDQFNAIRSEAKSIDVSITDIEKKDQNSEARKEEKTKQNQNQLLRRYWDQSDRIIETQLPDKNRELNQVNLVLSRNSMMLQSNEKNIPSGVSINDPNMIRSFQQNKLISSTQLAQNYDRKNHAVPRNGVHNWISSFSILNCCKRVTGKKPDCTQSRNHRDIEISFMDYFWNYFGCCESKKSRLIRQGTDLLYRQIDIFYILDKLSQIDKLKQILLTKHQHRLFDILPKQVITEVKQTQNQHTNQPHSSQFFRRHSKIITNGGNKSLHSSPKNSIVSPLQNSKIRSSQLREGSTPSPSNSKSKFMKLHFDLKTDSQENCCDGFKNYHAKLQKSKAQEIQESIDMLTSNAQILSPIDSKILSMLDYPHSLNLIQQKHEKVRHNSQQQKNEPPIQLELLDEECSESILDSKIKSNEDNSENDEISNKHCNINFTSKTSMDKDVQNANNRKNSQRNESHEINVGHHTSKSGLDLNKIDHNNSKNDCKITNEAEIDLEKQVNIAQNKVPHPADEALNEHDESAIFQSHFIQESDQNKPQTSIQLEHIEKASIPQSTSMIQFKKQNQSEQS